MSGKSPSPTCGYAHQWVGFYRKIPDEKLDRIKKEADMDAVETTITEHIFNHGVIKGEARGEARGRKETAINLLKMGTDTNFIISATGLSEEEIKQLATGL
ncbi:MAG: hypothetical protein GY749_21165 [Desulfobacteraceae bacterium]|nr:hypothetical protein [Desulfobacteraceae bacterium]